MADLSHFPPDEGPTDLTPQHGLVTIGAVPWVVNYNIPVSLPLAAGGEAVQGAGSSSGGGGGGAEGSGAAASAELFQLGGCMRVECWDCRGIMVCLSGWKGNHECAVRRR